MNKTFNYPYPVLMEGIEDYIDCSFELECIDFKTKNEEIILSLSYALNCIGLKEMLEKSQCSVYVQIYSRISSYRRLYKFEKDNENISLKIRKNDMSNKIELFGFILAEKDIDNFVLDEHNKVFFGKLELAVKKFDKLGISNKIELILDPIKKDKPNSSIFKLKIVENTKKSIAIDLENESEKVYIYLKEELYKKYEKLRGKGELDIFISSQILIPVLVEVLCTIKNDEEKNFEKYRWYRSINAILEEKKIDIYSTSDNMVTIADEIFNDGLLQSLLSLEDFYEEGVSV